MQVPRRRTVISYRYMRVDHMQAITAELDVCRSWANDDAGTDEPHNSDSDGDDNDDDDDDGNETKW